MKVKPRVRPTGSRSGSAVGEGSAVGDGSGDGAAVGSGVGGSVAPGVGRGVEGIAAGWAVDGAGAGVIAGAAVGACVALGDERRELRHELGGGEDERAAEQRDGEDGHDERARRAHRAAQDLRAQVGEPGVARPAAAAVLERGQQDPLVEVRRGSRRRQGPEEAQDPGASADLAGARRAALDVGGEACRVARFELIEQERVDQGPGARAIQGIANVRVRHTTYMTRGVQKVACSSWAAPRLGPASAGSAPDAARPRWRRLARLSA